MADLPKAPQHEGVDPLTKGKKYQDGEDLKENSTFENAPTEAETEATERGEQTLADQEARNAEANTPTEPDVATEPTQDELESAEIAENGTVGEGESEVADTAEAEQPTE